MKKILIIIGIIVVVASISAVIGYKFLKKSVTSSNAASAIYGVPIDAVYIIQTTNLYECIRKIEHENDMWTELLNIPAINKYNAQLNFLDSLFRLNQKAKYLIKNKASLVSSHLTSDDKIDYLFLVSMPESVTIEEISEFFNAMIRGKATVRQRKYNNIDIYDVKFSGKKDNDFSFTLYKGIFLLSFYPILLETSVRQLDTEISLLSDKGFKKIIKTAGQNVDANLYINYKELPRLLMIYGDKQYKKDFLPIKHFACWTELDVNLKKDGALLNGFSYTNDSSNNYLNVFLKQSPQTITIPEILPGNTSVFLAMGLSDLTKFHRDYKKYLQFSGYANKQAQEINAIKKETGIDIEKLFISAIDKEIGIAFTDIENSKDFENNSYIIINTKNRTDAEEEFSKLITAYATKSKTDESSFKSDYKLDDQTVFKMYKMPYPGIISKLYGSMFSKVNANYFTFIDNFMIFGNTPKSLGEFVHYKILQKTLGDDNNYKQFYDNLTGTSNFYFYSNIARSPRFYSSFFNQKISKIIIDNTATFQRFQAFAFQFKSMNDMLYNNFYIKYNPVYLDQPRTIWETKIDTLVKSRPLLVENFSTDEKCIFVQDEAHNIFLINSVGNKLWRLDIKEKIMGEVYQVDYYNNGKIQFLFNTKNYIYIVDILGNYLKQFPLKLRSLATNGLTLAEGKKKDFTIYVAGEDKKIYAYNKDGGVVKEWGFKKTDNPVYSKIQFYKQEKKEYIVFSDTRKTYISDKKGAIKIKLEKEILRSKNNPFYLHADKKNVKLVTTDTSGAIKIIASDGSVTSKKIKTFSSDHYFLYEDVNNDGKKEFVFADKNKIEVYKENTALIYQQEFEGTISSTPVLFSFAKNAKKLGFICRDVGKIYLLNSNGSLYSGFPLLGKTMFSIGYFTKDSDNFNLVVGGSENYIYNYEVK